MNPWVLMSALCVPYESLEPYGIQVVPYGYRLNPYDSLCRMVSE